jgi:hypothetical protein
MPKAMATTPPIARSRAGILSVPLFQPPDPHFQGPLSQLAAARSSASPRAIAASTTAYSAASIA